MHIAPFRSLSTFFNLNTIKKFKFKHNSKVSIDVTATYLLGSRSHKLNTLEKVQIVHGDQEICRDVKFKNHSFHGKTSTVDIERDKCHFSTSTGSGWNNEQNLDLRNIEKNVYSFHIFQLVSGYRYVSFTNCQTRNWRGEIIPPKQSTSKSATFWTRTIIRVLICALNWTATSQRAMDNARKIQSIPSLFRAANIESWLKLIEVKERGVKSTKCAVKWKMEVEILFFFEIIKSIIFWHDWFCEDKIWLFFIFFFHFRVISFFLWILVL